MLLGLSLLCAILEACSHHRVEPTVPHTALAPWDFATGFDSSAPHLEPVAEAAVLEPVAEAARSIRTPIKPLRRCGQLSTPHWGTQPRPRHGLRAKPAPDPLVWYLWTTAISCSAWHTL